ncbi:MAG: hypothetical protein HOO98_17095 [Nitrospira sp.]|nr:hypothetical protein [Nitrospira sp.]
MKRVRYDINEDPPDWHPIRMYAHLNDVRAVMAADPFITSPCNRLDPRDPPGLN